MKREVCRADKLENKGGSFCAFPGCGRVAAGRRERHHRRSGEEPRQAGNPAAGSAKGSSQDEREFFKKCVDNGGNMDNAPPTAPDKGTK